MKPPGNKIILSGSSAMQKPLDAESIMLMRLVEGLKYADVERLARRILASRPRHPLALKALGFSLIGLGRYEDALPIVNYSLERNPNDPELLNNLGIVLSSLMRWSEAIACFDRSLAITANDPEVLKNYGTALARMHRWNDAVPYFLKAIEHHPGDYLEAIAELGGVLVSSNRIDEAWTCFNELWKENQESPGLLSQLINVNLKRCHWDGLNENLASLRVLSEDYRTLADNPFILLSCPGVSAEEQMRVARNFAKHSIPSSVLNAPDRDWTESKFVQVRRLRIGFLSSDYKNHPVGFIIAQLIELHDRTKFEVFGYSTGFDDSSAIRRRLGQAFDHFVDLADASVAETAQRVRADAIDILVDLNGWTAEGRPEALSLRCAPVQVNWLGYAGTIGHARLADYLLGDPVVTPLASAAYYTETLAHLPHCYLPADTSMDVGVAPTRRDAGLPVSGFVFCSFNNSYKFNPAVFDQWCRLLRETGDSCLWLTSPGQTAQDNLRKEAQMRGINPARIVFAPFVQSKQEHLARIQLADLALDTFPYNSHSSGVDTLWAGVPMVALLGDTFPGRVGASLLRAAGLGELVAESVEQYYELALALHREPLRLLMMRTKLAKAKQHSPLFDMPGFVRDIENIYQCMWSNYLGNKRSAIT